MAYVDWFMQGREFNNCNCATGCPCQFNALPTHGDCRALAFVQIERGRFGDVPLDGLRWGILASWPGPIHFGDGTLMVVVEERADAAQRAAIEAVAHGRETEPGSLIWQVFSTTLSKVLPTQYRPIELEIDVEAATARLRVPGLVEGAAEPIRNPVTGQPHRARVILPTGFEFIEAEYASGTARTQSPIELVFDGTHAMMGHMHWSTKGVVRH